LDGVKFQGYLAYDENIEGKRPGILVVHEWWGLNPYAKKRAEQLAQEGYTAFAIDMYGDGKLADHPENAQKFMMEVLTNMPGAVKRFDTAMGILKSQPTVDTNNIAAIGYCFGGAVVLQMAKMGNKDLKGVASFHGALESMYTPKEGEVQAELLILHGKDDPFTPREKIDVFIKELDDSGAKYEFIEYDGAVHSFTVEGADEKGKAFGLPLAYNKAADEGSWAKMKEFFDRIFK
jgi:dienelactone hydrolase